MKKISIISFVLLSLPNLVEARNKHKTNFDVPPKVQRSSINHLDTSSLPEHSGNYTLDNSHYTSTRKNTSNMLAPKKRAANNKELKQPQTTQHISPRKNSESEQQNAPTELLNFVFSTPWRDLRYRKNSLKMMVIGEIVAVQQTIILGNHTKSKKSTRETDVTLIGFFKQAFIHFRLLLNRFTLIQITAANFAIFITHKLCHPPTRAF